MTKRYEGKVLFSIFIEETDEHPLPIALKTFGEEFFPLGATPRANAETNFTDDPRIEQIGFYYDDSTDKIRGVLTGVAAGYDLVEITDDNRPQLVGMGNDKSEAQKLMTSIVQSLELDDPNDDKPTPITWILTVLAPLDHGNGPLYIGGMGGIQDGDE